MPTKQTEHAVTMPAAALFHRPPPPARPPATRRVRRKIPVDYLDTDGFPAEEHLRIQFAIEQRAHELWRASRGEAGRHLDHWLQAEAEVLAEYFPNATQL